MVILILHIFLCVTLTHRVLHSIYDEKTWFSVHRGLPDLDHIVTHTFHFLFFHIFFLHLPINEICFFWKYFKLSHVTAFNTDQFYWHDALCAWFCVININLPIFGLLLFLFLLLLLIIISMNLLCFKYFIQKNGH